MGNTFNHIPIVFVSKNKNCPIWKRRSSTDDPIVKWVNFTMKELTNSSAGRQKSSSERKTQAKMEVCSKHPEVPHLFCEDEQRAVCPVCEFSLHQNHKVVPIEQAVSDLKKQLKSDLKSLLDKKEKYKQMEKTYDEMTEHITKQVSSTERQIRAEFNNLRQLLKEEEECRLTALWEEEEQKRKTIKKKMKKIEEQISSLSDRISAGKEELQKDNVSFLSSYEATQSRARAQSSLPDPQLVPGALIDVAKHLGNLSFRVWEKMKEKVHFSPIILDPNTASRWLSLSDDLTSVKRCDTKEKLPDNPERNINYTNVFGSDGFSSGTHSWEVEVGDHPRWNIGLVKESVDRKGETCALPKYGIWCLVHGDGKYTDGEDNIVTMKQSLQRIKVHLDYDRGEVSFYDSEDMSHIHTHRHTFTEKLFPYFCVGKAGEAEPTSISICKTKINF
ncbi:E3 ubiquitin-protein ligase TRIM35-like [Anableps anableps]